MKRLFTLIALSILAFTTAVNTTATAQPRQQKIQVILIPCDSDAVYETGKKAKVKVMALHQGVAMVNPTISYEISEDLMAPRTTSEITLKGTEGTIEAGTMKKPGYLRIKATITHEGKKYSTTSTVGFSPEKLQPTVKMPKDFMDFWGSNLEKLKKVDLKPTMELLPDRCTKDVNVYHISYRNIGGTRMYGILTMPAKEGKYPAILRFPGAGVGEKGGDITHAAQGAIILEMGIHGIAVNLPSNVYSDLGNGILNDYPSINLGNRDTYYYKRVYLGCVKGIDFLLSLPQCNGNVGTFGGSQGGALSIVTSALDSRIKASVAYFPALCDIEGYCNGRAGGWPHTFKAESNRSKENIEMMRYYDVANFARHLQNPIHYLYGYNDITCAPTSTRATYNAITAPKQLIIGENIGHWTYPEQMDTLWKWIIDTLK